MFSPLLTISLAFAPSPTLFHTRLTSTSVVSMKKGAADNDDSRDERVMPKVDVGSICEFHDPKHGPGSAPPVLGVVKGVEFKAKGGARIMLTDADDNQLCYLLDTTTTQPSSSHDYHYRFFISTTTPGFRPGYTTTTATCCPSKPR